MKCFDNGSKRYLRYYTYPLKRGLLGSKKVGQTTIDGSDDDMNGGDKPRIGEVVEDDLVLEVECNVQSIPIMQKEDLKRG